MSRSFMQLSPNLYLVGGNKQGCFPLSNALFIMGSKKALVDTGFSSSIALDISQNHIIDVVINTHFHFDHVYHNKLFSKAEIWAHELDTPAIESKEKFLSYVGFDGPGELPIEKYFPLGIQENKVTRKLSDREVLDFGSFVFTVIHTPGHSPGHIVLYEQNLGLLFAADINLHPFGPWYGYISSNLEDFYDSVDKIISLHPKILITGHEDPHLGNHGIFTKRIEENLIAYRDKIIKREERIWDKLKKPHSLERLVEYNLVYRSYPQPEMLYRFYEKVMIKKHLEHLLKHQEIVVRENGLFCR